MTDLLPVAATLLRLTQPPTERAAVQSLLQIDAARALAGVKAEPLARAAADVTEPLVGTSRSHTPAKQTTLQANRSPKPYGRDRTWHAPKARRDPGNTPTPPGADDVA